MSEDSQRQASEDSFQPGFALKEPAVAYGPAASSNAPPTGGQTEDQGWTDFRNQCRRQMRRPMEQRIKYGFCRMYKPVLDDAPWRAFHSMAAYRAWCETNLPNYLGFKRPAK